MASRRFFAYDPYDYYYTAPYHYPYPYYYHQQQPAPSRRTSGFFPVAAGDAGPAAAGAAANPAPKAARSVSIPVHFVGSDPEPEAERERKAAGLVARMAPAVAPTKRMPSAEEAAVRLQAAARGFMARRTVRAVREVEREVEEVAGKVAREAEALRGDARARIAVGEALMRLLLRLDAVRGAREYRRRVTRRVLALQDAVDALEPRPAPAPAEVAGEPEAAATEATAAGTAGEGAVTPELTGAAAHSGESEAKAAAEAADEMEVDGDSADGDHGAAEEAERASDRANLDADEPEDSDADAEGEWEMVTEQHAAPAAAASPDAPRQEPAAGDEIRRAANASAGDGVDARKVMEMVVALCERNVQQCAVIGALAERVDALERAVRRVEDAERRRRWAKKLRKEGKGSNHSKCYVD